MNVYIVVQDMLEYPKFHDYGFKTRTEAERYIKSLPLKLHYRCSIVKVQVRVQSKRLAQRYEAHLQKRVSEMKKRAMEKNIRKIIKQKEKEYSI